MVLPLASCGGDTGIRSVARVQIREPEGMEIEAEGKGRELQVRVPFRGASRTCGMQKNAAFLDVGAVECTEDPGTALASLLVTQLRKAGFKVDVGSEPTKPTTVQIDGELLQLYTEPVSRVSSDADIYLHLTARSGNGLLAERNLFEKGRGGDAQRSVNSGVRKMLTAAVQAITELMDQYPMLGKATGLPSPKTSAEAEGQAR